RHDEVEVDPAPAGCVAGAAEEGVVERDGDLLPVQGLGGPRGEVTQGGAAHGVVQPGLAGGEQDVPAADEDHLARLAHDGGGAQDVAGSEGVQRGDRAEQLERGGRGAGCGAADVDEDLAGARVADDDADVAPGPHVLHQLPADLGERVRGGRRDIGVQGGQERL